MTDKKYNPVEDLFFTFYNKFKIKKHNNSTEKDAINAAMYDVWEWHCKFLRLHLEEELDKLINGNKRLFDLEMEVTRLRRELETERANMDYPNV